MGCDHLRELLKFEREILEEEIRRHKWLESERAGRDVGRDVAIRDFCEHHLNEWAESIKTIYCGRICEGACGKEIDREELNRQIKNYGWEEKTAHQETSSNRKIYAGQTEES